MRVEAKASNRDLDFIGLNATGSRDCYGSGGVSHQVRRQYTDFSKVVKCCNFDSAVGTVIKKSTVAQNLFDKPNLASARHAGGEPDGSCAFDNVGIFYHRLGHRIVHVVNASNLGVFIHLGFCISIGFETSVPVEVVVGQVEHSANQWLNFSEVVQLKTRKFNNQGVVANFVANRVQNRCSDVSASNCSDSTGVEHCLDQLNRCGLAIGAGYRNPFGRATNLVAQAPGEVDVYPNGDFCRFTPSQNFIFRSHAR